MSVCEPCPNEIGQVVSLCKEQSKVLQGAYEKSSRFGQEERKTCYTKDWKTAA